MNCKVIDTNNKMEDEIFDEICDHLHTNFNIDN